MKEFLFTITGDEQDDLQIPNNDYQKVPEKDIIVSECYKDSINTFANKHNLTYEWEYHQDINIGDELTFYNNTNGHCVFYKTEIFS